jgi:hypothetical protein
MDGPRRSDRKRTQTQFLEAKKTRGGAGRTTESVLAARRAHDAAVASAYEPMGGLKQLGEVGGEGRVRVGADGSPALPGFAPPPAERQRALDLVQQYRLQITLQIVFVQQPATARVRLPTLRFAT